MAEGVPEYFPTVSVQLSRVFDEIGVNKYTIKRRRDAYLMYEEAARMFIKDLEKILSVYIFGSQTEGATTQGLDSDMDRLLCNSDINVIQDWGEWKQGEGNLLLLQEDTAPGYRRLQVLRPDVPLPREDLPGEHYAYDKAGKVLQSNTVKSELQGQVNGPAISQVGEYRMYDTDNIYAMKCASLPCEADDWKRRYQNNPTDWITQDLIQKAEAEGFFLVPVGYKLSETPDLEWRVSLSYTERLLMFNMNVTMIQCYVALKLTVKTFITPMTGKTITSYHCKTTLFHCIEHTGKKFWREINLLQCIQLCLERLLTFIRDGNCPHFIMPQVNLFDGKITPTNKVRLLEILEMLIQSNGKFLFDVHLDGLGHLLQHRLSSPDIHEKYTKQSAHIVKQSSIGVYSVLFSHIQELVLDLLKDNDPRTCIDILQHKIQEIHHEMQSSNTQKRCIIKLKIAFLNCWMGSILSSVALSSNKPIPNKALQFFHEYTKYSITPLLKLASVFYNSNAFLKAESILCLVQYKFQQGEIFSLCSCGFKAINLSEKNIDNVFRANPLMKCLNYCTHCVMFTKQDMYCAPPALRNEMYRSMGDDMCHRDPEEVSWMDTAVVDSPTLMFYLQYLTYGQLGKRGLQTKTLYSLEHFLKSDVSFGHLETGWNLLGQCMEQENNTQAAMSCYQTSLEIRPRNNAANWHLQRLQYKTRHGKI